MKVLLVGNDHVINVTSVRIADTGAYINNATVTARILNRLNIPVSGQTWPLTLSYVLASNGNYTGTFEDAVVLTAGEVYAVEVSIDAPGDVVAFYRVDCAAEYRTE